MSKTKSNLPTSPAAGQERPVASVSMELERSELAARESTPAVVTVSAPEPVDLLVRMVVRHGHQRVASPLPWTARSLRPPGMDSGAVELQMHLVCRPPAPGRTPLACVVAAEIATPEGEPIDSAEVDLLVRPAKED